MSNDKMRESFELTFAINWVEGDDTCKCWELSWQASRAALVIELPDEQPGYMYYAPDVVEAIEASGVRIAEPETDDLKSSQEILDRVRAGQEAVHSAADVRKDLGLDDEVNP
jgi:predicted DNA-binding protein